MKLKNISSHNVGLIGAGNIGSRHLQGIAKSKLKLNLFIIDSNKTSLELSKSRYNYINKIKRKTVFSCKLKDLPKKIDILIVATNSVSRKKILLQILKKTKIKYLILEKYTFQNSKDFLVIKNVLKKNKIKTWVNCPLRYMKDYINLKKKLNKKKFHIDIKGGNWNMASTMVHYIDLFCYYLNDTSFNFIKNKLNKKIILSKHKGCLEVNGSIKLRSKNGSTLTMTDDNKNTPTIINFFYNNGTSTIFWKKNIIKTVNLSNKKIIYKKFKIMNISDLTNRYIEDIINKNKINLPTLNESSKIQIKILNFLSIFFKQILKKNIKNCPIT